jgi:hypothetical protein
VPLVFAVQVGLDDVPRNLGRHAATLGGDCARPPCHGGGNDTTDGDTRPCSSPLRPRFQSGTRRLGDGGEETMMMPAGPADLRGLQGRCNSGESAGALNGGCRTLTGNG